MKQKRRQNHNQRNGLLAKIHIAKKELGLDDQTYQGLLFHEFGVRSAAGLSIGQMERLVGIFNAWGWQSSRDAQIKALQARALEIADRLENGRKRLGGLVIKICRVDRLEWCQDPAKLGRLLAALGKIERGG